jgi:hypothetical protein
MVKRAHWDYDPDGSGSGREKLLHLKLLAFGWQSDFFNRLRQSIVFFSYPQCIDDVYQQHLL